MAGWLDDEVVGFPKESDEDRRKAAARSYKIIQAEVVQEGSTPDKERELARLTKMMGGVPKQDEWPDQPVDDWPDQPVSESVDQPLSRAAQATRDALSLFSPSSLLEGARNAPAALWGIAEQAPAGVADLAQAGGYFIGSAIEAGFAKAPFSDTIAETIMNIGADTAFNFRINRAKSEGRLPSQAEMEQVIAEREKRREAIKEEVDRIRLSSATPFFQAWNNEFQGNMRAVEGQGIAGNINDVFARLRPDTDAGNFIYDKLGELIEPALSAIGWGVEQLALKSGASEASAKAMNELTPGALSVVLGGVGLKAPAMRAARREKLTREQMERDLQTNPDQYLQKYYPNVYLNLRAARHGKITETPGSPTINVQANLANTLDTLGVEPDVYKGKTVKEMTRTVIDTIDQNNEINLQARQGIAEALARQVDELERIWQATETAKPRLLAPPTAIPGMIEVSPGGIAATPAQRAAGRGVFEKLSNEQRAEVLGQGPMGQLRTRADAYFRAIKNEGEGSGIVSGARDSLETAWAQAFPLGKEHPGISRAQRRQVMETWINEGGPFQSWEALAARVYTRPARPKPGDKQAGVVQIEGLKDLADLNYAVLARLPGATVLTKKQVEQVLAQPDIRGAERDVVRKVLNQFEGDSIPARALAQALGKEAMPLELAPNRTFASLGHERVATTAERVRDDAFVVRAPIRTEILNDFGNDPHYVAHLRGFQSKDGIYHLTEVQSTLAAKGAMPPALGNTKYWHERVLREVNKKVAQHVAKGEEAFGPTMRVPLGATAGKIQNWERQLVFDERMKTEPKATGRKEDYVSQVQGLFDFYDKDIRGFVQKEFGAREVTDAKGNRWMEWDVQADAATQRVPIFGPLLPRSKPGGREAGVVELPGASELPKSAKEAAEGASAIAGAPKDKSLARRYEAGWKAAEEFRKNQEQNVLKRLRTAFRDRVADHQGTLKRTLVEKGGEFGREVVDRLNVLGGSVMKGKYIYEQQAKPIFRSLNEAQTASLDRLVSARNMIEARRRNPKYKGRDGRTPEEAAAWVEDYRATNPKEFAKVDRAADKVFQVYVGQLNDLVREGLLSAEEFGRAVRADTVSDITRIIDPEVPGVTDLHSGKPGTTSGIPHMRSTTAYINSRELLAEVIGRTQNKIMRNQAAGALYNLAELNPDLGFVRTYPVTKRTRSGKAEGVPALEGYRRINFWKEGKEHVLLMEEMLGDQWHANPPSFEAIIADTARLVSGTSLVKALATSYNPTFPISGIPMDAFHVYLAGEGYSSHLPIFMAQFTVDMLQTMSDSIRKGSRFQQAIMEGLGFDFMTHEGRGFPKTKSTLEKQFNPQLERTKKFLSWINETAEINVRLAHRERLIKSGMPSWQATSRSRSRLDYSQGGSLSKAVDVVVPYSNVAIQGWKTALEEMNRDPVKAASKLTWATSAIAGVTYLNMIQDPEAWRDIPVRDKLMGLPFLIPEMTMVDSAGVRRVGYVNLRSENVLAPLHALVVGVMEKAMFGEAPEGLLKETIAQLPSLIQIGTWPVPAIEAWHRYASNYDIRADAPIWTGMKVNPEMEYKGPAAQQPTSTLAMGVGGMLGASPQRLESATRALIPNNPYIYGLGKLSEIVMGNTADPSVRTKGTMEALAQNSIARRVIKFTHPAHREVEKVDRAVREQGSKLKPLFDTIDAYVVQYTQGEVTAKDVEAWLTTQPPELQEKLGRRFKTGAAIEHVMRAERASEGVPSRVWWMNTSNADPQVRADLFFERWISSEQGERTRMERIAGGLSKFGVGYSSDEFKRHFGRLRQQYSDDQR